jgi:hypothetical protein
VLTFVILARRKDPVLDGSVPSGALTDGPKDHSPPDSESGAPPGKAR